MTYDFIFIIEISQICFHFEGQKVVIFRIRFLSLDQDQQALAPYFFPPALCLLSSKSDRLLIIQILSELGSKECFKQNVGTIMSLKNVLPYYIFGNSILFWIVFYLTLMYSIFQIFIFWENNWASGIWSQQVRNFFPKLFQSFVLTLVDAGFLEELFGRNEICHFWIFIQMKNTIFQKKAEMLS